MADDWEVGGPIRLICGGYEKAPRGAVIHLRLLAGVFRLVLTDRAMESRFRPFGSGASDRHRARPRHPSHARS
jgi:hypothetical protein